MIPALSTWQSREGLLLASLAVIFVMRMLQRPFLADDPLYIKRFMLAASGALGLLILMMKLLLFPMNSPVNPVAALFGAGMFAAYLGSDMPALTAANERPKHPIMAAGAVLVLISALTIVAARWFGDIGFFILAPAMLAGERRILAYGAALYFVIWGIVWGYLFT